MTAVSSRSLRSRVGSWGVYLIITSVLTLGTLEGVTRLLHLAPGLTAFRKSVSDPYLPYRPRPSSVQTLRSASGEFEFAYAHNRFGFRDTDHSLKKPPGVFRILGLGDSFTYGDGVGFDQTYLYRLERLLNSRAGSHPRVEIIKAGIFGYTAEPERLLLQHYGLAFDPDLVLVGFSPNDILDTVNRKYIQLAPGGYLRTRTAAKLGRTGVYLYVHCHSCRILLAHYARYTWLTWDRPSPQEIYRQGAYYEDAWTSVEQEYDRMVTISKSNRANFVLVHIPGMGPWKAHHSYPPSRLSAWASKRDVAFIDVLPAMKTVSSPQSLYWPKDRHPNAAGHRVIAERISSELVRRRLVP